jgi:hypothetical protein
MEQINYFISSRGFLKSSTIHSEKPRSSSAEIDFNITPSSKHLESIYICTDALENFILHHLDSINFKFILISGDSDIPVNSELLERQLFIVLLNSQNLVHWYAQNLIVQHEKISQLPIGMDYHTMWERPGVWGLKQQSSLGQERSLIEVLSRSASLEDRSFTGYCNWHFALHRGDREICLNSIQKEFCFFESQAVPRLTTWQRQSDCAFVISPEGAGIDCHRTWEAILLGCVPIIKKSSFSKIFDDLPVIQLDDWAECNSKNIKNRYFDLIQKKFDFSILFLAYWDNLFRGKKPFRVDLKTQKEFKNLICVNSH